MKNKALAAVSPEVGKRILQTLLIKKDFLSALEIMHQAAGDIFQIPLPGFNPFVLVGPEANRLVLATERQAFLWRNERDPVTRLLRHGLLVEDGETHDSLRRLMSQALHKRVLANYVEIVQRRTDQVIATWGDHNTLDMLVEMRKIALLILMESLFGVDFSPELPRLWSSILKSIEYISPGLWILLPDMPRPGYRKAIQRIDSYLFKIITERRQSDSKRDDLLGVLTASQELSDDLVRDQLLTMLIAGHDTSTALLSWALYLLGKNPEAQDRLVAEVGEQVKDEMPAIAHLERMAYLDRVVQETARMYPPIHVGNRIAARDLEFNGVPIPAGSRVMYSIYLSHRQPKYWQCPDQFDPDRFAGGSRSIYPYSYVPFGGGPRNCIGMAFAQVEVKIVLARLLQKYHFKLIPHEVHAHMGATLEPRPGVWMHVVNQS